MLVSNENDASEGMIFEMTESGLSRRRPEMESAVEVVLTDDLGQFTARAILKTRDPRGFKSSWKPVLQAGASPQQTEFLAAAGDKA